MSVIGVLAYFDESPTWLTTAIIGTAPAIDHLVALDGGYALFPGALSRPASSVESHAAVDEACRLSGLSLTHYVPSECFAGNEVQKRNLSLDLARAVVGDDPDSWFLVFDADYGPHYVNGPKVKKILANSDHVVGEYARYDYLDIQALQDQIGFDPHQAYTPRGYTPVRGIYRNVKNLKYGPAHWHLSAEADDGTPYWLWGNPNVHVPYIKECEDLTAELAFDHRNPSRDADRTRRAKEYYSMRHLTGAEDSGATLWMIDADGNPRELPAKKTRIKAR